MPVREKGAGSQWSRKRAKGQAWLCNPVALRSSLQEAWGQKKKNVATFQEMYLSEGKTSSTIRSFTTSEYSDRKCCCY